MTKTVPDPATPLNVSIRDTLREETRAVHDRLHDHASFVALFDGTLSAENYRALMKRLFGFYAPLDRAILAALNAQAKDFDYLPRSGLLSRDLCDLGLSPAEVATTPTCAEALDIVTPQSVGGVLYVVEGATLGGATIDRSARKLLGDDGEAGRRFWAWCRAQSKSRWRLVNSFLLQSRASGAETRDLVTGARDAFRVFYDWLEPLDTPQAITTRMPV